MIDNTTLAALSTFPALLNAHYAAVPASYVHWTPPTWDGIPSERFTAIEQICHVRDVEIDGYHVRFQRCLSEATPFLPDLGSEALAMSRDYAKADATQVFAAFREARAKTLDLIANMTETQLARTAFFEDYGPVTLRSLVHFLCSHDQQHLAGLQWLLGKIESSRMDVPV